MDRDSLNFIDRTTIYMTSKKVIDRITLIFIFACILCICAFLGQYVFEVNYSDSQWICLGSVFLAFFIGAMCLIGFGNFSPEDNYALKFDKVTPWMLIASAAYFVLSCIAQTNIPLKL